MCSLQRGTRSSRHRHISHLRGKTKSMRQAVKNYQWQDDVLAAVEWAWPLRPCANFWCAASTYSMELRPTKTCSKKTHTQARDARCLHTSELTQSIFSTHDQEMCTLGWVKEARIPDSDEKKKLSHDGLRRSCSFGISVSQLTHEPHGQERVLAILHCRAHGRRL